MDVHIMTTVIAAKVVTIGAVTEIEADTAVGANKGIIVAVDTVREAAAAAAAATVIAAAAEVAAEVVAEVAAAAAEEHGTENPL